MRTTKQCRVLFFLIGLSLLPAIALAGCASSNSLLETAHTVHSYTPCGMLMNAVMDHSGPGAHEQDAGPLAPQTDPAGELTDTAVHAH